MKYSRIPTKNAQGAEGFRYTKNGLITKESRIPHEVMEKFQYTPTVDYDDAPERRRCIFCDAPQGRQSYLNGQLYDLCEWHYQHVTKGQIAAQVREKEREVPPPEPKKGKKTRKTALSNMI